MTRYPRIVWLWCVVAYWLVIYWPLRVPPLWLLPWAGMYGYSDDYAAFLRCPMFRRGA